MSYGPDLAENYRRAAALADRILKGARPADLPVEEPSHFTLCVNLKTAKAGCTAASTIIRSSSTAFDILSEATARFFAS